MNVPVGTWMGAVKVDNDEVWNEYVKTNKVRGFSIEGYFADKMEQSDKSNKEDMEEVEAAHLLSAIEKIVRGEKVELTTYSDMINRTKSIKFISQYRNYLNKSLAELRKTVNNAIEDIESSIKYLQDDTQKYERELKELGLNVGDGNNQNYKNAIKAISDAKQELKFYNKYKNI